MMTNTFNFQNLNYFTSCLLIAIANCSEIYPNTNPANNPSTAGNNVNPVIEAPNISFFLIALHYQKVFDRLVSFDLHSQNLILCPIQTILHQSFHDG